MPYRRRWLIALALLTVVGTTQACDEASPEGGVEQQQEQPENEPTGIDIPEPEQEEVEATPTD